MELKEAPLELSSENLLLLIFLHNLFHFILKLLFMDLLCRYICI